MRACKVLVSYVWFGSRTKNGTAVGGVSRPPAPSLKARLGAGAARESIGLRGRAEVLLLAEVEVFEVRLAAMHLEFDGGCVRAVEHERVAVKCD